MSKPLTLNDTHVRLIQWLCHYPFQRLEDLVVALSPWCGRTTVYTHLKALEQARFVEFLQAPLCPGKRLYHLAPAGLAWHLHATQTEENTLDAAQIREILAAERAALLRMLPRVPAWLTIQTTINGLVMGAPSLLTQQGHRARLVRWNWQRDVSASFSEHGQVRRWFADGAGAFCLRFAPSVSSPGTVQECRYRFFLLHLSFTHPQLMRARLDRLLRWREASERWRAYTQMPPILVLATSARQAEWWHEAVERVTHSLGVSTPLGAVACLPSPIEEGDTASSPWAWAWRRFGNHHLGQLREVFTPQDDPGFPDMFPQETLPLGHETACSTLGEKTAGQSASLFPRRYRYQLANIQTPAQQDNTSDHAGAWRRHCLTLTPRQWELLWLVLVHPLLGRENLRVQLHLEGSALRHVLGPLVQRHLLVSYETGVGERFALGERGLRVMAAAAHCPLRALIHHPQINGAANVPAVSHLLPRGLPGLLTQIKHLAGIYGLVDQVAELGCLRWWETGMICARFYQDQQGWRSVRPDAVIECQRRQSEEQADLSTPTEGLPMRIFLEWDHGTMHRAELQRKMETYTRYLATRAWARESQQPPTLLCVVPDASQEQRFQRVAHEQLRACSTHFSAYTTTRGLLLTQGITGAIWRQVWPVRVPCAETPGLVRLFFAPITTHVCNL